MKGGKVEELLARRTPAKKAKVMLSLSEELYDQVRAVCRERAISPSEMVDALMADMLARLPETKKARHQPKPVPGSGH